MAQDKARSTRARKTGEGAEKTGAKKTRTRTVTPAPAAESVAFHAYLLWEQGEPGDPVEHWLRAERELAAA